MTRRCRWAIPTLVAFVPLGFMLPAIAQRPGESPGRTEPVPMPREGVDQAKELARLIQDGQLSLRDATSMAEKRVKGTALEVSCSVQAGTATPSEPGGPQEPRAGESQRRPGEGHTAGAHIIYTVKCFADDKIQAVRIDGQEKKVIEVKECKALGERP